MGPKKSVVRARAAGAASVVAREQTAGWEHLGRNLKRARGELIPRDSVS